ncbi:unnamed protein product, partial [Heterosigma akashiwo]
MEDLTIVGLQLDNKDCANQEEVQWNRELAERAILDFPSQDIDLFLLPELYTCGYGSPALENLEAVAEDRDGESFRFFSAVAKEKGCYICYGYPQRCVSSDDDQHIAYKIAQNVVGPDGQQVAHYAKMHLCHYGDCSEKDYFAPGNHPCVFEIRGVRVGLAICYDMRFPELFRHLAWGRGCDVILHPSCFPKDAAYASWRSFVCTRALENQVYFLSLSRAGPHFGGSLLCPPWFDGSPAAEVRRLGDAPGHLALRFDRALVEAVRREFSFQPDR